MLILDTDHLTEYQKGTSEAAQRLKARLDETSEPFGTTIITVEEIMRGWMAAIRRTPDPSRQVNAYGRLRQLFHFFANWDVIDWTPASAATFAELKGHGTGVGTMDLKIASIALVQGVTLLSRNVNDFSKIPALKVVDWMT